MYIYCHILFLRFSRNFHQPNQSDHTSRYLDPWLANPSLHVASIGKNIILITSEDENERYFSRKLLHRDIPGFSCAPDIFFPRHPFSLSFCKARHFSGERRSARVEARRDTDDDSPGTLRLRWTTQHPCTRFFPHPPTRSSPARCLLRR